MLSTVSIPKVLSINYWMIWGYSIATYLSFCPLFSPLVLHEVNGGRKLSFLIR